MSRLKHLHGDTYALRGPRRLGAVSPDRIFVGTAYRVRVTEWRDDGSDELTYEHEWTERSEAEAQQASVLSGREECPGCSANGNSGTTSSWSNCLICGGKGGTLREEGLVRSPTSVTRPYADGSPQWIVTAVVEAFEARDSFGEARS